MRDVLKLLWFGLSFLGWVALADAGTYNFYINNTEQGDHGTSTPTVTVKDGKNGEPTTVEKTGGDDEATKSPALKDPNAFPATENPEAAPAITPNTSVARAGSVRPARSPFRFTGGVGTAEMHERKERTPFNSDPNSDLPFWEQHDESRASESTYEISGEYFPHPVFGMGIIFGKLSGLEAIVAPFGMTASVVQPEFIVGYLGTKTGFEGQADPFIGARLNVVVHENVALIGTLRKSIETNPDLRYTQMMAGVSLRF